MKFQWDRKRVEIKRDFSMSKLKSSMATLVKLVTQRSDEFCL